MKPFTLLKIIPPTLLALALPCPLWSATSPCDLDWSAVQGLRVDVEDSSNCGGNNSGQQNVSASAALKRGVDCGEYILAITVQGSVEDQDAGFDYVYVNGVNYFSSRGNEGRCNMWSTSETRQITVKAKDSIVLNYDTVDGLYHTGGYAQITNIALMKAPEGCGGGCSSGSCSGVPGGGSAGNSSVDVRISLGEAIRGLYPGLFHIKRATPDAAIYTPDAINYGFDIDLNNEVIRSGTTLRQVLTEQALADLVVISAYKYEIRFYHAADAGTKVGGVYVPTGTAFRTWTIEDPDLGGGSNYHVRVTDDAGGTPAVHDYTWVPANQNWTLVSGNLKEIGRKSETIGSQRIETYWIKEVGGSDVFKQTTTYETFAWGEEKVAEAIDPDNLSGGRVTAWTYYDNVVSDGVNYSRLKSMTSPDGYWERYEYDAEGRTTKTVSPFGDSLPSDPENTSRVITRSYSSGWPQETEVETVLGQEVGRRYTITDWLTTRDIVAAAPGAGDGDSANLVTETVRIEYGEFQDQIASVRRPDGTMTFYAYSRDGATGVKTTVIAEGVPDAWGTTVVDGTRTTRIEDSYGNLASEEVEDIASNLLLSLKMVVSSDVLGRPTRIEYLDGTAEEFAYGCCGLQNQTDRQGVATSYTYDALKRKKTETRAGVTLDYTYNAADQITRVTRIGSDSSPLVVSKAAHDLAGREVWTEDALSRRTTYAYVPSSGGGEVRTTTHEGDGSTIVETYRRDGRVYTISGTAVSPQKTLHGAASGGLRWTQEIVVGEAASETEWVKTWKNMLGQTIRREYPDTAEETYAYDAVGRLIRQTDADGVQTLFAYNDRSERIVTAIDLDQDGVIDYDGTDRITRTTTIVADKSGTTVSRTTNEVWATPNTDTATTVSVVETSADGLATWRTVYDLTTQTLIAYDGLGGRIETTTHPDASRSVRTYANGLLMKELRKDASAVTLSETDYTYDPHGRLNSQGDAGTGTTSYTYYADDQLASSTTPDPDPLRSGDGYDPQTTSYTYNARGWQSKITQPDSAETHTTYYPTGQVKRTWGARTYPVEYTYDAQGRMKTLTTWQDFDGTSGAAVTTWNYDTQRGWLTGKRYDNNQGPNYTYTDAGRLATRTWARGVVTTYDYTNAGDLWTVTYDDDTPSVTHTYHRDGRNHTTTDAAGVLTRTYTGTGKLDDEVYSGGATGLLNTLSLNRGYDTLDRLDSLTATGAAAVGYDYDDASRLKTITQGTHVATVGYKPNVGTVQTVTVAVSGTERAKLTRTTDTLGRVKQVDTTGNGTTLHARRVYTYNDANQRTRVEHEDAQRWAYGYDALGQVTSAEKRLADDTTVLPGYKFGYAFDDIGNRTSTVINDRTSSYTPNDLNQYIARQVAGAVDVRGSASAGVAVVVNDLLAARTGTDFFKAAPVTNTSTAVNAAIKIQAVKASPEQVATENRTAFVAQTPEVFGYDDDGNLTTDGRWTYTWDGENRLIAMETLPAVATAIPALKQRLEFAYDGQGRRIAKTVKTWSTGTWAVQTDVRFLYDGWNLVGEYVASGLTPVQLPVWGLDLSGSMQGAGGVGGLLWVTKSTATHVPGYDGNGNVIAWVDSSNGSLAGEAEYGAFGEPVLTTGVAASQTYGFSTKYLDAETGRLYYGFRYYNPSTGRWPSRDPMEEEGGLSVYGFVDNSPLDSIDPNGLWKLKFAYDRNFSVASRGYISMAARADIENGNGVLSVSVRGGVRFFLSEVVSSGPAGTLIGVFLQKRNISQEGRLGVGGATSVEFSCPRGQKNLYIQFTDARLSISAQAFVGYQGKQARALGQVSGGGEWDLLTGDTFLSGNVGIRLQVMRGGSWVGWEYSQSGKIPLPFKLPKVAVKKFSIKLPVSCDCMRDMDGAAALDQLFNFSP